MDLSLINGAVASLNGAVTIGKAAIGIRDFNKMAAEISEMNAKLLDAQQSLFSHSAQLMALQQDYFEATKQLAEAKEALAEKGRYAMFEIVPGSFAYRADARPAGTHNGNPVPAEPEHYICQPCFDSPDRRKAVLRLHPTTQHAVGWWHCPVCKTRIDLPGQAPPLTLPRGRGGPNSWMGS